jgi:hypothetical protein
MRTLDGRLIHLFLYRTIVLALIAAALPAPAAGQQPSTLWFGERVDVELRDRSHVAGKIAAVFGSGLYVQQPTGELATVRYTDVRTIRDLDTGMTVAMPQPHYIGWVKTAEIGAAIVGVIMFIRITGCFGHCNY